MWRHQRISRKLLRQLVDFLRGKSCEVFYAPFDVRLNADTSDNTVLQPDIVVICDRSKLSGTGCIGVPDMVIEILSPSTEKRDREDKFDKYLEVKVREYWIVDPDSNTVTVNILDDKRYCSTDYCETDKVPVHVLEGCVIDLADVFAE
jgi:Uma2 family endonuclease